jgi:superfamily I DNA/RNA helicase
MNNSKPIFITGDAGTGKTSLLMKRAGDLGARLIGMPVYQSVLAITHMHGARRRVDSLFREKHPLLPVRVTTIHSFALDLINRWRGSLGYQRPILVHPHSGGLREEYGSHRATFDETIHLALNLLQAATVRDFIKATYPLIIVDELQDCTGSTLDFIKSLAEICQLLAAADDFQQLGTPCDASKCEALQWLQNSKKNGTVEHIDLSAQRRTDVPGILEAARCLKRNLVATRYTIPKYWAPKVEMLAWKIVFPFLGGISGNCAVICPSSDPQLHKLIQTFDMLFAQKMASKNLSSKVRWFTVLSSEQEREVLYENLGIDEEKLTSEWNPADEAALNLQAQMIQRRVQRFKRLTGIQSITTDLVAQFAQSSLHADRSYAPVNRRYEVTTVHGAKNREFDHVFVFWGYKVQPGQDNQRKLLYNAITRAKKSCVLLVQRQNEQAIVSDPVLRLLGQYQFVFPSRDRLAKSKKTTV